MERDQLAQLLDIPGYAASACRHALLDGAEFIVWDGQVPASQVVPAYQRRQAHTASTGVGTLGFPEALAGLQALGEQPVRLGQVTVLNPPYLFMLFLTPDGAALVACLGIDQVRVGGGVPRAAAPLR